MFYELPEGLKKKKRERDRVKEKDILIKDCRN